MKKIKLGTILIIISSVVVVFTLCMVFVEGWEWNIDSILILAGLALPGVISAISNYYGILKNRNDVRTQNRKGLDDCPIKNVTLSELENRIGGKCGLTNYIDRKVVTAKDLRITKRILIRGVKNLGKSREAIELIRQAIDQGLVNEDRIFEPAPFFEILEPDQINDEKYHCC